MKPERHVEILLKVIYSEPKDLLSDYLTSLGVGGLFINTTVPLEVGAHIAFSISFPGLLEPREFRGVVRWRRLVSEGVPEENAGLGVEFDFAGSEQQAELEELLESLRHPAGAAAPVERSSPFRVLLVEDNDIIQDLFAYAVRCFHYEHIKAGKLEILRASDGLEALRILDEAPVDLAIVDHFLPAMTGSKLIRKIRENPRHASLPILVLSVGDDQVKREALESGADLFLHKPVMNKHLVQTLSTLLMRTTP
jgi:CheY-like chemotaxis protein